ncbi:hypothetical protein [Gordonia sp. (in: high G+C Gram-positive bacteria)]|uniref:hypothetical protein n=1 Tax=Gordonia sp. (in: high G+C Gram-positive bacteria) TaxID=84139 RepID=UPI0035B0D9EA
MNVPLHRQWRTATAAACVVIAAAVTGCAPDWEVDPATESVLSSTSVVPEVTATSTVSASSGTDTSDLANLMAIATHVFTGRVDGQAGTTALDAIPETQYRVRTGVSIKGSVPESVVVNQQGGITDRVYISVNGDTPLAVGQWYLFATRYLKAQNWYTLIPVDGRTPVTEQQAHDPGSPPLAAAAAATPARPRAGVERESPSPSLTFPTPRPGDHHPPPPSPTQPR